MYENSQQKKPKYEAKGIETVRRDGCPAVSKVFVNINHLNTFNFYLINYCMFFRF